MAVGAVPGEVAVVSVVHNQEVVEVSRTTTASKTLPKNQNGTVAWKPIQTVSDTDDIVEILDEVQMDPKYPMIKVI